MIFNSGGESHGLFAQLIVIGTCLVALSTESMAQDHFSACSSNTGETATIFLGPTASPSLNQNPLPAGAEIAIFTSTGVCAGVAVWEGELMAITAWGDDILTPQKDGFLPGDLLNFVLWDPALRTEITDVVVGFESDLPFNGSGRYKPDALYSLSGFSATQSVESRPPVAAVSTSLTSGPVPLEVTFDGASSEPGSSEISHYVWYFGDGSPPAQGIVQTHTYTSSGIFFAKLEVHDTEGRVGTKSVSIIVGGLSNEEFAQPGVAFEVFPNPFSVSTSVEIGVAGVESEIRLVDMSGRVLQQTIVSQGHSGRIELRGDLPSGSYVVQLKAGSKRVSKTIVKID